jgi:hypothetical protein
LVASGVFLALSLVRKIGNFDRRGVVQRRGGCATPAIKRCPTGSKSPRAPPHFLADNVSDLNAAQGLYAVSYQMQQLVPLYFFNLTTFHIDENESRHVVGDFKLGFARNLDVNPFGHFAPR